VRRVTDMMGEISSASAEQSAGIGQVNQAITQMDQVTQQNAALVEQAAAAAGALQEQAQHLLTAVQVFRMHGGQAVASPHVAVAVASAGQSAPARAARSEPRLHAPVRAPAAGGDWEEF
jgi:uncharacterized phage infection (PIP) family protein YhgE